jgi:hypothetical protein
MLVAWVRDRRVTADTWVFAATDGAWHRAADLPELLLFFQNKDSAGLAGAAARGASPSVDCQMLRRLKILAGLTEEQLVRFAGFMEILTVPQWSTIVKKGDRGDAMYVVLEGEVRVQMKAAGAETVLATLTVGDLFGEIKPKCKLPRPLAEVCHKRP